MPTKMMAKPTQGVEQQTSTWSTIFPPEQRTVQESATFVKKLLTVGISSITYLRDLFPENAYGDHCLDGLSLKVLTDESPCKPSRVLFSWIQSCYDAIDRQYLRQLTLVIYEDPSQPDVVLETYTYKFKYTGGGAPGVEFSSSSAQPSEMKFDVRKPTRKMLRTIFLLTQSLRPLPKKVHLGMRLSYYDDVTPPDYEPKGFATAASSDFQHEDESINIAAGEVNTRYHNVKVRVSVDKKHFYGEEKSADESAAQEIEEQESLNPQSDNIVRRYGYRLISQSSDTSAPFSQMKCITDMKEQTAEGSDALRCPPTAKGSSANSNINGNLETQASENIDDNNILPQTPPSSASYRVPEMSTQKTLDNPASYASTSYSTAQTPTRQTYNTPASTSSIRSVMVPSPCVPDPDFPVRCPCGVNLDDGLMILCHFCGNWQHAVCFKVLEEEEAPLEHICELCARPSAPCTDPALFEEEDIVMTCLYRRIIVFLRDYDGNVTVSMVSQRLGVDISMGSKIFTRLASEKILKKRNAAGGRKVNKECLAAFAFPGYLKRVMRRGDLLPGSPKCVPSVKENLTLTSSTMPLNDIDATPDLEVSPLQCTKRNRVNLKDLSGPGESQDVNVGTQAVETELSCGYDRTAETVASCPNDVERTCSTCSVEVSVQDARNKVEAMVTVTPKATRSRSFYGKKRRRVLSRAAKKNQAYLSSECL